MAKRLTVAEMEARYQALDEASEHLRMEWTDNETEAVQGFVMADWLQEQARKWLHKADMAREAGHS